MKKENENENRITYKLEMAFQHRIHGFLVEKQFMHFIRGDSKIKTLMLYFTNVLYLLFRFMKKKQNRNTHKLEMVFQPRIHDFLIEKQLMHLIQGDSKIMTLMLYFTYVRYLLFTLMNKGKVKRK